MARDDDVSQKADIRPKWTQNGREMDKASFGADLLLRGLMDCAYARAVPLVTISTQTPTSAM